jgi:putative transposase
VHGELITLGVKVAASTVWEIHPDAGVDPCPDRAATTWASFHRSQARAAGRGFHQTVTLTGARMYILAVIEHATRRIRILGTTPHPTAAWGHPDRPQPRHGPARRRIHRAYLIRDRDGKDPALFDTTLADSGITVVRSGIRIPRMHAIMKRWVRRRRSGG